MIYKLEFHNPAASLGDRFQESTGNDSRSSGAEAVISSSCFFPKLITALAAEKCRCSNSYWSRVRKKKTPQRTLKIGYKKFWKKLHYWNPTLTYLNSFGKTWVACSASSWSLEKWCSILQAIFINFKKHYVLQSYFLPSGLYWVCEHFPRNRLWIFHMLLAMLKEWRRESDIQEKQAAAREWRTGKSCLDATHSNHCVLMWHVQTTR